jgi:hypothetical protein
MTTLYSLEQIEEALTRFFCDKSIYHYIFNGTQLQANKDMFKKKLDLVVQADADRDDYL